MVQQKDFIIYFVMLLIENTITEMSKIPHAFWHENIVVVVRQSHLSVPWFGRRLFVTIGAAAEER